MATVSWHGTGKVYCRHVEPAELLEERVYPADFLADGTPRYQVRGHKCSQAEECRELGLPCCWTGINPNYDPFERGARP